MNGQRVGYVRVSTVEQNTERQLDGVAVDKRFEDKASGKDTARPQLAAVLEYVRDGDTLVVHSMDRLARSLEDLRRLVRELTARGVRVEFVKENLTFTGEDSPMSNLLLSMLGAVAVVMGILQALGLPGQRTKVFFSRCLAYRLIGKHSTKYISATQL